jgi:hypothetical protein
MWQTLETKARFIHQVMRGETSVRSAEDHVGNRFSPARARAFMADQHQRVALDSSRQFTPGSTGEPAISNGILQAMASSAQETV